MVRLNNVIGLVMQSIPGKAGGVVMNMIGGNVANIQIIRVLDLLVGSNEVKFNDGDYNYTLPNCEQNASAIEELKGEADSISELFSVLVSGRVKIGSIYNGNSHETCSSIERAVSLPNSKVTLSHRVDSARLCLTFEDGTLIIYSDGFANNHKVYDQVMLFCNGVAIPDTTQAWW
jgi:hypothetical protein